MHTHTHSHSYARAGTTARATARNREGPLAYNKKERVCRPSAIVAGRLDEPCA